MAKISHKPRVIFAGTAEFAIPALAKLLKLADICLVITQPAKPAGRGLIETHCPVDLFAQDSHLPIFRPTSLKRELIEDTMRDYECDYLIVAAYGKILPQWLLNFPKYRALNIHGSLLPKWRGASPIQHALLAGDKKTGVNLMEMTLGMDEGPILLTLTCDIQSHDTVEDLTKKLGKMGADLLDQFLRNPQIKSVPQEGDISYAPKIEKVMGQIDWHNHSASTIQKAFRAFTPWPGLYSWTENNLRLKILSLGPTQDISDSEKDLKPGALKIEQQSLWALCKDQWIALTEIQMAGKNKMLSIEALKDKNHWIHTLKTLKTCGADANV